METFLKVNKGNVELYNSGAQRIKTFYSGGNAVRVDWYNQKEGSVQVQLSTGQILIINSGCQIVKRI